MFIELVDALRCPRTHEESWLVLAASRIEARHIQEGALGCPVCRAEYPIRDGIVDLRLDRTVARGDAAGQAADAPRITDRVPADHLAAMLTSATRWASRCWSGRGAGTRSRCSRWRTCRRSCSSIRRRTSR